MPIPSPSNMLFSIADVYDCAKPIETSKIMMLSVTCHVQSEFLHSCSRQITLSDVSGNFRYTYLDQLVVIDLTKPSNTL